MNFKALQEERKLIACNRQGSISVVLPQMLVKLFELQPGDIVTVGVNETGDGIEIKLKGE